MNSECLLNADLTLFAEETLLHAGPSSSSCHFSAVHVGRAEADTYAVRRFVSAQSGQPREVPLGGAPRRFWHCRDALRLPPLLAAELCLRRVGLPPEVRQKVLQHVFEALVSQPGTAAATAAACEEEHETLVRGSGPPVHVFFWEHRATGGGWTSLEAAAGGGELSWLLLHEEEDAPGVMRRFVAPPAVLARVAAALRGDLHEWYDWPPAQLLEWLLVLVGGSPAAHCLARGLLDGSLPLQCPAAAQRPPRDQFWAM